MDRHRLTFAVAPVAAAAGLGGLGARRAPETYVRLRKPPWAPPAAVFGPVWTVLYVAIGAAGWRLYASGSARTRTLHLTQLTLNAVWPLAFFAARRKPVSLAVIGLLDATLVAEVARARNEDPRAAALLTPYLAWSAFATALNLAVSEPESR